MKGKLRLPSHPSVGQSIAHKGEAIICIGRLHFLVRSASEGGYHCVDFEPQGDDYPAGCTCTSYRVRGACRHFEAVADLIGLA